MAATTTLRLHGLLQNGEFSSILLAQRDNDAEITVLKCFNRVHVQRNPEALRRVLRERWSFDMLSRLPHPFHVGMRFAHVDGDAVFLGMEHVGGGDLFSLLQQYGPLSPDHSRVYAAEVALALGHVHAFDMMYRDLKVLAHLAQFFAPQFPVPCAKGTPPLLPVSNP